MTGKKGKRRILSALLLVLVTLTSAVLFIFCFRYDNKYTRPRPPAQKGIIHLDGQWYQDNPFFYLADGWSFYQGKLLSPEEIPAHTPDRYFHIGRYGGFDLGDPEADPHGQGTYRTVILTAGQEQNYALELTPIYSRWRIWVNGTLVQSVGMGDPDPTPPVDLITFRAADQIEIVVAAADDNHFYSGMVYPPAFGEPRLVSQTSSVRLLLHSGACAVAMFIAVLCLVIGGGEHFSRPYGALAALCLCFSGSTAWPIFQILAPGSDRLLLVEQVCYYGIFVSLMWIQGRVCGLPRKLYYPACGAGVMICLGVILQPHLHVATAAPLYAWSQMLSYYKWFTGLWLLLTSGWAVYRSLPYSEPMLAGNGVFASALAMDKLLPSYEPVLTGWFVELAGGILILLIAGLAWYDMMQAHKDRTKLLAQQHLTRFQLDARARYAGLQQEYVRKTREQLHETRNRFTLMKHYLDTGQQDQLIEYLDRLILPATSSGALEYTGHGLVDAILTVQLAQAAQLGIYTDVEADRLPVNLSLADNDLTSLLMNILNNAVEACQRLPEDGQRWISLRLECGEQGLMILCSNSANTETVGINQTSKEDKQAHGYGLRIISEITAACGGDLLFERETDSFSVRIHLPHVSGDTP